MTYYSDHNGSNHQERLNIQSLCIYIQWCIANHMVSMPQDGFWDVTPFTLAKSSHRWCIWHTIVKNNGSSPQKWPNIYSLCLFIQWHMLITWCKCHIYLCNMLVPNWQVLSIFDKQWGSRLIYIQKHIHGALDHTRWLNFSKLGKMKKCTSIYIFLCCFWPWRAHKCTMYHMHVVV